MAKKNNKVLEIDRRRREHGLKTNWLERKREDQSIAKKIELVGMNMRRLDHG